jgi:uncharacterized protein (TIGR02246 family)
MKFQFAIALSLLATASGFNNHAATFGTARRVESASFQRTRQGTFLNMGKLVSEFKSKKSSEPMMAEVSTLTDEEVRSQFFLWNQALQTKDSNIVAKRYSKTPVLLPTISNIPRTDVASIKDYFDNFLQKKPSGKILEGKIITGPNWAQDAGIYEFVFGADGSIVKARYTFVYVFEDDKWRIAHHHSSVLPESIASGKQAITVPEVQALFKLWNDALATLNSTTVAKRYSKKPCLLPTVSDVPRTDFAGLKDYFDAFLTKKPQGVILDSNVFIGNNWAQDAGIYKFTLGATGQKVKARYSFIYVFEDGEWMIQHHHSSVMPEGIPAAAGTINASEVRALFTLWNDALATLDPAIVTNRYAAEGVLLPTVSDTPRNTKALINDYFTAFLQKKPQGEIISGDITIGEGWAQDAGIYEFTMGVDGSKVKARYSFIYVYENDQWKIAHHHSSVMPESFLAPAPAVAKKQIVTK